MTKNDLVNSVAAHGLSKRQSSSVVESVFDIIFRCFEKGEDVKIVGFGHFRIRRKASRRGREQLELGIRETQYADTLRRVRERLVALRARLAP